MFLRPFKHNSRGVQCRVSFSPEAWSRLRKAAQLEKQLYKNSGFPLNPAPPDHMHSVELGLSHAIAPKADMAALVVGTTLDDDPINRPSELPFETMCGHLARWRAYFGTCHVPIRWEFPSTSDKAYGQQF